MSLEFQTFPLICKEFWLLHILVLSWPSKRKVQLSGPHAIHQELPVWEQHTLHDCSVIDLSNVNFAMTFRIIRASPIHVPLLYILLVSNHSIDAFTANLTNRRNNSLPTIKINIFQFGFMQYTPPPPPPHTHTNTHNFFLNVESPNINPPLM